ncbi:unnamed protein product [Nesidiocoris tenuis]|uniref:Uncharacterized protein n=1 Tax=Nesidiocoris tenuis TaxID=355587 RepID=A0A6H5G392_9HEMI|nr:unnamed protein product [Nesidiocoris tenuis]
MPDLGFELRDFNPIRKGSGASGCEVFIYIAVLPHNPLTIMVVSIAPSVALGLAILTFIPAVQEFRSTEEKPMNFLEHLQAIALVSVSFQPLQSFYLELDLSKNGSIN